MDKIISKIIYFLQKMIKDCVEVPIHKSGCAIWHTHWYLGKNNNKN